MDIHSLPRPRVYANSIIGLPTSHQRADTIALVPAPIRDWVEFYVTDHFWRRATSAKQGQCQRAST